MDSIATEATLNEEQKRAFSIVAQHSTSLSAPQLKMYLGGMGGTGKSQVIKCLIKFFETKGEPHKFIVLAPTGTAAALLNGSTYHSILGINPTRGKDEDGATRRSEATSVNDAATRLKGVRYIFIDEISMIACHELYAISAHLSAISDIHTLPFGGFNMILAGDFAQLPPTSGKALYYQPSADDLLPTTLFGQQTVIGKLIWHQFTTVVILKQNMRQNKKGGPDASLRTALENMRYVWCMH
jgi:ATP-dependent DNA helicase PIF1